MPWTIACIAGVAWLSLAALAYAAPPTAMFPWLGALIAACGVWTAAQTLPLPCGFTAWIAPESARDARAVAALLHDAPPSLCALTRDPGATQQEILKGVAIACAFLAAWLLAANGGRRNVLWMIASSSLAMSLVALGHAVFELDTVFGLYQPIQLAPALLLAPIMNPNSLGAFAALGAPIWLGLAFRNADARLRMLGYGASIVCVLTTLLSFSRGAIAQLVLTLAATAWILVFRSSSHTIAPSRETVRRVGAISVIGIALGIGAYVVGDRVTSEFREGQLDKLSLIARAFRFALDHAWIGVGRGAFSSSFVAVEGRYVRFVYPENFLAQWLSEWGFPVTLVLLGGLGYAVSRALRRRADSFSRTAAIIALLGLTLQNLVDFGFELAGVAVVAAALLAAVTAPSTDDPEHKKGSTLATYALLWTVVGLGAFALVTLAPRIEGTQLRALDGQLRQRLDYNDRAGFKKLLRRAVGLHPSEPVFAMAAADEGMRHNDRNAGGWLSRAMQLAPGWAAPHLLAYQWLWRHHRRSQALLELRTASEIDARTTRAQACLLAPSLGPAVFAAAPRGAGRQVYLEQLAECVEIHSPTAEALDQALLREFPSSSIAQERAASRLYDSGKVEEGLAAIDELLRRDRNNGRARVVRTRMLFAGTRYDEAASEAERALPSLDEPQRRAIIGVAALAHARAGRVDAAERAVHEVRRLAGTEAAALAESFALEGQVHLELKHHGEAFRAYREAYRINQDTKYLEAVGGLATQLGDHPQALWAFMSLCERLPAHPSYCSHKDALLRLPSLNSVR